MASQIDENKSAALPVPARGIPLSGEVAVTQGFPARHSAALKIFKIP
ncbi:hypothetical protein [Agrobacterium sp. El2ro-1b]